MDKPKLSLKDGQIDESVWEFFEHEWEVYKVQANVTRHEKYLLAACLDVDIRQQIFNRLGKDGWEDLSETQLLDSVKEMFIRKKNRFVNRIKLTKIVQGPEELVQQYLARLKQTARTCLFTVKCSGPECDHINNYSDEMVLDQLVNGLYDPEIQAKVLTSQEKDLTIVLVENVVKAEELSRASQRESKSDGSIAGMQGSSNNKGQKKYNDAADGRSSDKKCFNCGQSGHFYQRLKPQEKSKCPAHGKTCRNCGRENHLDKTCRSKTEGAMEGEDGDQEFLGMFNIAAMVPGRTVKDIKMPVK